jgi:hypothetical protein
MLFGSSPLPALAGEEGGESPPSVKTDAGPVGTRMPVPPNAAVQAARKAARDMYAPKGSINSAGDKHARAAKMLAAGIATADNATDRYALLSEALDLASSIGDADIVINAANELSNHYQVDGDDLRAEGLSKCYAVSPSPRTAAQLAVAEVGRARRAARADQFDEAAKYAGPALTAARNSGDPPLVTAIQQCAGDIQHLRGRWRATRGAFEKLRHSPDDAPSCEAAGEYLCFEQGDWAKGLPLLARGTDQKVKRVASMELAVSADPGVLADQWWSLGESRRGTPAERIREHAAVLYRRALPGLTGLAKATAESRLAHSVSPVEQELEKVRAGEAGPPRELLPKMVGGGTPGPDNTVILHHQAAIHTEEQFSPPVAFHVVVETDLGEVRLQYAADQIIFDWERKPDELRVDGGPAGGRHKPGAGSIPLHTWVAIDLVVTPTSMKIYVDGKERYETDADFSQVDETFGIKTEDKPTVVVKSVQVRKP